MVSLALGKVSSQPGGGTGLTRLIHELSPCLLPGQLLSIPHERVFPVLPVAIPAGVQKRLVLLIGDLVPADVERIDLNRASRSELESLPGIGPVTAGKIMAAREDERFGSARELRSRGLVGEKVYEDVKALVRAG